MNNHFMSRLCAIGLMVVFLIGSVYAEIIVVTPNNPARGTVQIEKRVGAAWVLIDGPSDFAMDPAAMNGDVMRITAFPDPDYEFVQWTGDIPAGVSGANPAVFIQTAQNRNLVAQFEEPPGYGLAITIFPVGYDGLLGVGVGHVLVNGNPYDPNIRYDEGQVVTIEAVPGTVPNPGGFLGNFNSFVFEWGGDIPDGIGDAPHLNLTTIHVTMNDDKEITLLFSREYHPGEGVGDLDLDGLPDEWELRHGLDPKSRTGVNGAGGNPSNDYMPGGWNPAAMNRVASGQYDPAAINTAWPYRFHNTGVRPNEYYVGIIPFNNWFQARGFDGWYGPNPHLGGVNDDPGTDPNLFSTAEDDEISDGWKYYFWGSAIHLSSTMFGTGLGAYTDPNTPPPTFVIPTQEIRDFFGFELGIDPSADPDNDCATMLEEFLAGTDPFHWDTDGDGISDGFELRMGLDPLDWADARHNDSGDYMAFYVDENDRQRRHHQVYNDLGFDPRTGWGAQYYGRGTVRGRIDQINTIPFSNLEKFKASVYLAAQSGGMNGEVLALTVGSDGVYAGGNFTEAAGLSANRVARWADGTWNRLGPGVDGAVRSLAAANNDVYAGGAFLEAGDNPARRMARWDSIAETWNDLEDAVTLEEGVNGVVHALAVDSAGNIYVGGTFTEAGGDPASNIAMWDPATDTWSALGVGVNGAVRALAVDSMDNLYVGGAFTDQGNYVARWNGVWSPLGLGVNAPVDALAVDSADNVYVGGLFDTADGAVPANHIALWDPLAGSWSALGLGVDDRVQALVVDSLDNVYAGGRFQTAGERPANYIAHWDGAEWRPLAEGLNGRVNALALDVEDTLYVGGLFTRAGFTATDNVAYWKGESWWPMGGRVFNCANFWSFALDPFSIDSDDDGIFDGWELYAGLNPMNRLDAFNDPDGDGLNNFREFSCYDLDLLHDGEWPNGRRHFDPVWRNKVWPTDPWNSDTDGDGLTDGQEGGYHSPPPIGSLAALKYAGDAVIWNGSSYIGSGLNPTSMDTDGDMIPDHWEARYRSTVYDINDLNDRNGMDPTLRDANRDYDDDGLLNYQEYLVGAVHHWRYRPDLPGISDGLPPGLPLGSHDPMYFFTGEPMHWDWHVRRSGEDFRYIPPINHRYNSTNPRLADTDRDGMDDYWKIYHGLNPVFGVYDLFWGMHAGVDNVFAPTPPTFDIRIAPYAAGYPLADPDQDGLPNWAESLQPNDGPPYYYHTDPSPLWITDPSYQRSWVNLYYAWNPLQPWYFNIDVLEGRRPPPTYMFSFEVNEGFDTDGDFVGDRAELVSDPVSPGVSDPLSVESPVRRAALYLEGAAAARTRAGFLHEYAKLNNFTIEAWVRPANPAAGQMQVILERPIYIPSGNIMLAPGVRLNFRLALDADGVPFVAYNGGGFDALYVEAKAPSQVALTADRWHHVAGVYDGDAKQLRLYVDGQLRRTVVSAERPFNGWTPGNPAWVFLGPMVVGAEDLNPRGWVSGQPIWVGWYAGAPRTQPDLDHHFHGWVDEVRVWNGVRTGTQIEEDMPLAKTMRSVRASLEPGAGPELMYLYNFNDIHDPIVERVAPDGFELLTGRPNDGSYPHVPWWGTADDRSVHYDNYLYVPWIANVAARLPLDPPADSPINRQVIQLDIETTEVVTNIVDVVDEEGEPTGEQILEVVTNVVIETETRINQFPNTANPYNMAYYHASQARRERNPDLWLHTDDSLVFSRRNANLFNDLLPLGQARTDITVELWDGHGVGGNEWVTRPDIDEDGDGIPDWWQRLHWPNFDPYAEGLNPWNPDADPDGSGLPNYWQYRLGADPHDKYSLDPDGLISDADWDSDGDGLSNIDEIMVYGTDPLLPDTDNDGWGDGMEVVRGQDPLNALNPLFRRALRVDGNPGSYVRAPDDPRFALDDFTLLAWVRPPAHGDLPPGQNVEIIAREIGPNLFNYRLGWWWDPNVGDHRLAVEFNPTTGGSAVRAWTDEELPVNEWSHVAGVFDQSRNVLELYVDGEVARTSDAPQRPRQKSGTIRPVARVGRLLDGMIDDVVIYDQALTRAQIHEVVGSDRATDPARGAMYDGLVLHYQFSSDKGALIPDLSGNRLDGTVSGGVSWRGNVGVTFGSSLRFDGVNARLTVPDDYRLELYPVNDKTFSLWWRDSGGGGERPLLSRRTAHQPGFLFSIDMGEAPANGNDDDDDNGNGEDDENGNGDDEGDENGNGEGSGRYWLRTGLGWFNAEFIIEPDRYWHHVVLVKDGGTWRMYHNGQELEVPKFISVPDANARAPLSIGWDPLLDRSFNGFMDEIRIYDRVLSPAEIEQLQNETTLTAVPAAPWPAAYYVFDDGTNPNGTSGNPLWDFGQVQDFAGAYNQDWRHNWRNAGTLVGNAEMASRQTGVLWVTSPNPDGIYYPGDVVTLHVVFGEPVVVVDVGGGTPRIELEMRDANRFADFTGNVAPNVLAFDYVVQLDDWAWHLDYASVNALTLQGGTIQDPDGNNLNLTLPAPGAVGSLSWAKNLLIDPPVGNWVFSLAAQAGISEDWLILYFDGTGPRLDPHKDYDGDGMTLLEEFIADTNPLDPYSRFQFLAPQVDPGPNGLVLRWKASAGRVYTVEYVTLDELVKDQPDWVQYGIKLDGFNGDITVEVPFESAGRVYRVRVKRKD